MNCDSLYPAETSLRPTVAYSSCPYIFIRIKIPSIRENNNRKLNKGGNIQVADDDKIGRICKNALHLTKFYSLIKNKC